MSGNGRASSFVLSIEVPTGEFFRLHVISFVLVCLWN